VGAVGACPEAVEIIVNIRYNVKVTFTIIGGRTVERTELTNRIIDLQRKIDRAQRHSRLDVWMGLPLTIAQLKSLFFITNHGSTSSGKLAEALGVTPTNTTGIVDRLVKQGLVSRAENPEDRRMQLLRATDRGEELVAVLRERKRGYMSEVLGRMTMDDLTTLAQGLTSLARAADAREQPLREDS
jgi:DNA-binding MarR family transcriptional regulator